MRDKAAKAARRSRRGTNEDARRRAESVTYLAHDLRTSLHIIAASVELLLDSDAAGLPEPARGGIQRIGDTTGRLTRDVDDLLLHLRIAAGAEHVHKGAVDLPELLSEIVAEATPLCAVKGLTLRLCEQLSLQMVEADGPKLRRVLMNLVANAAKFTDEGGIAICAFGKGGEVVIRVSDTGPGIPEKELPYLFAPFWRGGHQDRVGSGLGLAIVYGLVAVMGGSIGVESVVGEGSSFEIRLPPSS